MAADTPGIWQILNGLAQKMFAPVTTDASGNITPQFAPRTNGAPVEAGNPLPVMVSGGALTGSVSVSELPSLPAGSNNIGYVLVSELPSLPAGGNSIGSVTVSTMPALPAGNNVIGTVAPRAPQSVKMTVLSVPANTSILAAALNPNRKSIQILNIGVGQATAMTYQAAGTGGTVPTAPGQTSATSNTVTAGAGYPLQPAAVAGQQGGSTPIYDGAGVSTDEWDVVAGSTATTILVVEGV